MKLKVGFRVNDKVMYKAPGNRKVPAVITHVDESDVFEMYTIRITSTKSGIYTKGNTFTTNGNYLTKR